MTIVLPPRRNHGQSGYRVGCRCDVCSTAMSAASAAYRERKRRGETTPRPARDAAGVDALAAALSVPELPGAKCVGRTDLFSSGEDAERAEDDDKAAARHREATAICRGCPSLIACARWLDSLPAGRRPCGVVAGRSIGTDKHRQTA